MTPTRDEFRILGFMKFYLVVHILAPLFLIGLTTWAVAQPGLDLSQWGPLILLGLAGWAVFDFVRLLKWGGFSVAVTDEGITVGKGSVRWEDVAAATVRTAFKFDTWIEIRPREGAPLKIPAAIGQKDLLLTLVEKHHPHLVKK